MALFWAVAIGLTLLVIYSEWIKPDSPSSDVASPSDVSLSSDGSSPDAPAPSDSGTGETDSTIHCRFCGAENDREFSYCGECVRELSPDEYGI